MALDMFLELEGSQPSWEALTEAATLTGVEDLRSIPGSSFDGRFRASSTSFWLSGGDKLQPLVAEGRHECAFLTQYVVVFRVNNDRYDESVEDLRTFLTHLARLSPMQFVLSFQYEGVYAVRDKRGFDFFWHAPR